MARRTAPSHSLSRHQLACTSPLKQPFNPSPNNSIGAPP
jgi:hypothetical protein